MANKFQVGDKVRVVMDLNRRYHSPGINDVMLALKGREFVVRKVPGYSGAYYKLENDDGNWSWTDDWLEPVYPEPEDINESEFLSMFGE